MNIYELLKFSPVDVYHKILDMRGMTIRTKISICAACLNDIKAIHTSGKDPKSRTIKIKKAAQSLEIHEAKKRIKDLDKNDLLLLK